jgi:hypothetical protein
MSQTGLSREGVGMVNETLKFKRLLGSLQVASDLRSVTADSLAKKNLGPQRAL